MIRFRFFWLGVLLFVVSAVQAQETIPLTNPIAYIGQDGNVYVTDGTQTHAVTTDAQTAELGQGIAYQAPRWSPDGTQLAFVRHEITSSIYVVASGQAPREIVGEANGYTLSAAVLAWSPDNQQIAFFGAQGETAGLLVYDLATQTARQLAPSGGGCVGEMGGEDPAIFVVDRETEKPRFREQYSVVWSEAGILYTPVQDCSGAALISPDGEQLQLSEWLADFTFAADGQRMIAQDVSSTEYSLYNLSTDSTELLPFTDIRAIGEQAVYFTRRESVYGEMGNLEMAVGSEIFGDFWGTFTAENATLELWSFANGEFQKLYATEGFDIGRVQELGDNRLLVSVITSNLEAVRALNEGATAAEVKPLVSHVLTHILANGEVTVTLEGGQAAVSYGTWTLVPPQ